MEQTIDIFISDKAKQELDDQLLKLSRLKELQEDNVMLRLKCIEIASSANNILVLSTTQIFQLSETIKHYILTGEYA